MPTYEYECEACGHEMEVFHSIMAKPLRKCPKCGKSKLKRLIGTGAGVIFKGSGFYETDYRSDNYKAGAKAETDKSSGKSEGSGGKDGAKGGAADTASSKSDGAASKGDASNSKSDSATGKSDSGSAKADTSSHKAETSKSSESKSRGSKKGK
jgi:putative FmdB family regulatory protein